MKGKLLFVAGAAVGYVLGARAGRKRYEQIKGAAERIWETPGVQNQVEQVKDFAAQRVGDIPSAIADGAQKAFTSLVSSRKSSSRPAPKAASDATARDATARDTTAQSSAAPSTATKPTASKSASRKPTAAKPAAKKTGASTAKKSTTGAARSGSQTRAKSKPAAESE